MGERILGSATAGTSSAATVSGPATGSRTCSFTNSMPGAGCARCRTAKRAEYRDGAWMLESVRRSDVSDGGVVTRSTGNMMWPARFGPDLAELSSARLESLSGVALARYISYLEDNRLDTAVYELALWTKIAYPLATGVMIFLAVPLVLGRLGGARIGQRILAGCLVAVVFHVVNEVSGKAGIVYGLSPSLSALAPTLASLATGVWLLRRVR